MNSTSEKIKQWNSLIIVAVVVMLGITIADYVLPKPEASASADAQRKQNLSRTLLLSQLNEKEAETKTKLPSVLWTGDEEVIGPKVLASLTSIAMKAGVTINAFRPQRTVEDGTLVRIPYLVNMEGPYTKVISVIRALENPDQKLGVTLVQITSTDGVSDTVSGTLGIVALKEKSKPVPASTAKPASEKEDSKNEKSQ